MNIHDKCVKHMTWDTNLDWIFQYIYQIPKSLSHNVFQFHSIQKPFLTQQPSFFTLSIHLNLIMGKLSYSLFFILTPDSIFQFTSVFVFSISKSIQQDIEDVAEARWWRWIRKVLQFASSQRFQNRFVTRSFLFLL